MPEYSSSRDKTLGLLLVIVSVFLINLFSFNKFFPPQEGWFQLFASLILRGETPYKDFYLFIPPGFPLQITILTKIFGTEFITYRIFGLIERVVLCVVIYLILTRLFSPKYAWIGTVAGIIYATSNLQDTVYGYYQSSILYSVIMVYCSLNLYENFDKIKNRYLWACLTGFFGAIAILYKQTSGILSLGMVGIVLLILLSNRRLKEIIITIFLIFISFCVPFAISFFWLQQHNALRSFLNETIFQATAKGSFQNILFSFLGRAYNKEAFIWVGISVFLAVSLVLMKKARASGANSHKILLWILSGLSTITVIILVYLSLPLPFVKGIWVFLDQFSLLFKLLILIEFVALFLVYLLINHHKNYSYEVIKKSIATFAGFAGIILITYYGIGINKYPYKSIHVSNQAVVFLIFYLLIIILIWSFFNFILGTKNRINGEVLLISSVTFALMYAHGMSGVLEPHALILSLPFILCLFFNNTLGTIQVGSTPINLKNLFLTGFCLILAATSFLQRIQIPYSWWGWTEPDINYSTIKPAIPELKGFLISVRTNLMYQKILSDIANNSNENDVVYTFPHIPVFNVLSGRKSPDTFAQIHYFDVCPDDIAIEDAVYLKKNPPKIIIWMDLGEEAWKVHEQLFRNGNPSGQRAIQSLYNKFLSNGKYRVIDQFENIYVLVRND